MFQMYSNQDKRIPEPHFNGAAVIDENGREIPITEAMIRDACEALEDQWHYPVNQMCRSAPNTRRAC